MDVKVDPLSYGLIKPTIYKNITQEEQREKVWKLSYIYRTPKIDDYQKDKYIWNISRSFNFTFTCPKIIYIYHRDSVYQTCEENGKETNFDLSTYSDKNKTRIYRR